MNTLAAEVPYAPTLFVHFYGWLEMMGSVKRAPVNLSSGDSYNRVIWKPRISDDKIFGNTFKSGGQV
jgi:hypothetical protein